MENALDSMFEDLQSSLSDEFSNLLCHVKVSQVKKIFLCIDKKKRGKVLGDKRKELFDRVKIISENIYNSYARNNVNITYNYFRYCKLIRNYGNFDFHFLVIKNEYK